MLDMLHSLFLFLFVTIAADPETEIDRMQLTRILEANWSEIHDLEFVFEGTISPTDRTSKPDPLRPGLRTNPDDFNNSYQGTFAWRSDESIHLDNYVQNVNPTRPLSRQITTLFRGGIANRNRVPDHLPPAGPESSSAGGVLSMDRPMSPIRITQYPIILTLIKAFDWYYYFQKWEDVSGRRLLVFDLSNKPTPRDDKAFVYRFWLDMERGSMPVQVEVFDGPDLRGRVSNIELTSVNTADGKQVWIPVRGKEESFVDFRTYSKSPVFTETYAVLNGTIRVNQGLPDSRFSLDYEAKPTSGGLVKAKATFDGASATHRAKQEPPQKRIDRALAEADRQSEQLQASAPSRESWVSRNIIPTAILAIGSLTLIGVGSWRWIGRR